MSRLSKRLVKKTAGVSGKLSVKKSDTTKSYVTASGISLVAHPLVKPISKPQRWGILLGDLTAPLFSETSPSRFRFWFSRVSGP